VRHCNSGPWQIAEFDHSHNRRKRRRSPRRRPLESAVPSGIYQSAAFPLGDHT
jgi:hypothetical protein